MKNNNFRFVNGWRLSIVYCRLADGHSWNVIIGVNAEGKRYMFSRHLRYDDAVWRMNVIDPDCCQYTPLN